MRTIAAILVFFTGGTVSAQIAASISNAATDSNHVTAAIIFHESIGSGTLDNHFITSFYQGHYLTRDLRNNTLNHLLPNNRLGASTSSAILYGQRLATFLNRQWFHTDLVIGLVDRMDFDMTFRDKLFQLAMFGNRDLAETDDTLHMGPFLLKSQRYQKMMAGMISDNGMGRRIGLTVSLVKGEQFNLYEMNRFNMYVPYKFYNPELNIGESLFLDAGITAASSSPGHNGINAWNGTGMALDFFFEKSYGTYSKDASGAGMLQLEISDLGFIVWNPNSTSVLLDTSINFTGVVVDGIQDIGDPALYDALTDNAPGGLLDTVHQVNKMMLPVHAEMRIGQEYRKQSLKCIISYKHLQSYTPLLLIEDMFKFGPHFRLGGTIGYGGFTTLHGGLSGAYESAHVRIIAGTSSLPGLIAYKRIGSISSYFMIHYRF